MMIEQVLVFMLKKILPVFCLASIWGCCCIKSGLRCATCESEGAEAVVKAYKDVWHSFYDEERLARMLVVKADDTPGRKGRSCCFDGQKNAVLERINICLNDTSYLEWKANADRVLSGAGADAYLASDMSEHARVIGGRIYQFPKAVEERLAEFDKKVEAERLERFVVEAVFRDKDEMEVSSVVVPDFKFSVRWCGDFPLPFHRLSSTQEVLKLRGERILYGREEEKGVSFADVAYEGVDLEDDRFSTFDVLYKVKKGYNPCHYVTVGDAAGSVVSNIISNMVHVPGMKYLACRYEVTQEEWAVLMGNNPSRDKGEKNPVENITWFECRLLVDVINSLPETQAAGLRFIVPNYEQWAFACYGSNDTETQYKASKTDLDARGWFVFNSLGRTHEVGLKEPNAFGLYDMMGNVVEYVLDMADISRTVCGGSYKSGTDWFSDGNVCVPDEKFDDVGFRLFAEEVP